jgi:hypothetical protein
MRSTLALVVLGLAAVLAMPAASAHTYVCSGFATDPPNLLVPHVMNCIVGCETHTIYDVQQGTPGTPPCLVLP